MNLRTYIVRNQCFRNNFQAKYKISVKRVNRLDADKMALQSKTCALLIRGEIPAPAQCITASTIAYCYSVSFTSNSIKGIYENGGEAFTIVTCAYTIIRTEYVSLIKA